MKYSRKSSTESDSLFSLLVMHVPSTHTQTSVPTHRDRRLLTIWCVATFFPAIGILVYLPASTQPALEHFSEEPHSFTAFLTLCMVVSLGIWGMRKSSAFDAFLIRRMRLGTATATAFFLSYTFYIYSFSSLPPAPNAPQIGEQAPDFSVRDPEGRVWALSKMKGDTLVFFYRGHW
jgi:hypothetical protein